MTITPTALEAALTTFATTLNVPRGDVSCAFPRGMELLLPGTLEAAAVRAAFIAAFPCAGMFDQRVIDHARILRAYDLHLTE